MNEKYRWNININSFSNDKTDECANALKKLYDSLINAGFSEDHALEIIGMFVNAAYNLAERGY